MCRNVERNLTEESEMINRWRQYFNEHLNGDEANRDDIEVELAKPAADNTFTAPELQEIHQEIKKLKNNRAAAKNRLPGELFKYEGEKLTKGRH